MENKNIKIVYQYDGSSFFGFQRQLNKKTVQGEIENTIENSFNQKINLISSGRTDKGVHAYMQVSNFFINKSIPINAIKNQLNKSLGKNIKILNIDEVDKNFNARYDAKKRTYLYILKYKEDITPFETDYVTCIDKIDKKINIEKLEKILKIYEGKHNFSSFMKKDKVERNVERIIYYTKCEYNELEKRIYIKICGNAFLKTMVRIMVGSALAVYYGKEKDEYIKNKLEYPDMKSKKILAKPEGLYLYDIEY